MPTNLPDPPKRKAETRDELFLHTMIALMVVGIVIACTIVGWSLWVASSKTQNSSTEEFSGLTVLNVDHID